MNFKAPLSSIRGGSVSADLSAGRGTQTAEPKSSLAESNAVAQAGLVGLEESSSQTPTLDLASAKMARKAEKGPTGAAPTTLSRYSR